MPGENPAPKGNRFSQSARLKRAFEFEKTRSEGQRLVKGCLILNWKPGRAQLRLGVVTSKKIGGAVVRSRARRLLREAFRLHRTELAPADIVLVARPSIAPKDFHSVERDFLAAARLARLIQPAT
jgi:ribonuclease P protein component